MRRLPLLALIVTSILIIGGASWAASRPSTSAMTACVAKSNGSMRMVGTKTSCKSSERRVSWNVTGPQGLPGAAGTAGPPGAKGANGEAGAAGAQGLRGEQGDAGLRGTAGPPGATGETGETGPAGTPGETGQPGPAGSPGEDGQPGPAGSPGEDGQPGEQGPVGPAGPAGATGETGKTGPAGTPGENGQPGEQGPVGPAGAVGPIGPIGPAGATGETGKTGPAGTPGENGQPGEQGPIGPAGAVGPIGPVGPVGAVGPAGPAGVSVLVSTPISSGQAIGPDGTYLASITLDATKNYLVTAGVTATAPGNDSLQCQLLRFGTSGWDEIAEIDLSARSTVNLEHVYRSQNGISGTPMTVYLACLSASLTYTVDVAHLNALQISTVNSSGTAAFARRSLPSLRWSS